MWKEAERKWNHVEPGGIFHLLPLLKTATLRADPPPPILATMKDDYIARKERWARKMAGKEPRTVRSENRLPPGQREVHNFPVLDLGIRPDVSLNDWRLKIHGHVQ